MLLEQNADLSGRNTLALPCVAERLYSLTCPDDVLRCWQQGVFEEAPLILGGGSNVILPARLKRPVICYTPQRVCTKTRSSTSDVLHIVDAGKNWDCLVAETVKAGLRGLENLSLIPGTVGAAPVQNIGAYGVELCDLLEWVEVFDTQTGEICKLSSDACQFAYRDSLFKRQLGRYLILSVALALSDSRDFALSYAGLEDLNEMSELTAQCVRDRVVAIRRSKLPDPAELPNAGSFFKNPVVDATLHAELVRAYPDVVAYPQAEGRYKVAAGWLIDRLGLKGWRKGSVGMHALQALVLANYGSATQQAVLALAEEVTCRVQEAFGISLEIEPVIVR